MSFLGGRDREVARGGPRGLRGPLLLDCFRLAVASMMMMAVVTTTTMAAGTRHRGQKQQSTKSGSGSNGGDGDGDGDSNGDWDKSQLKVAAEETAVAAPPDLFWTAFFLFFSLRKRVSSLMLQL